MRPSSTWPRSASTPSSAPGRCDAQSSESSRMSSRGSCSAGRCNRTIAFASTTTTCSSPLTSRRERLRRWRSRSRSRRTSSGGTKARPQTVGGFGPSTTSRRLELRSRRTRSQTPAQEARSGPGEPNRRLPYLQVDVATTQDYLHPTREEPRRRARPNPVVRSEEEGTAWANGLLTRTHDNVRYVKLERERRLGKPSSLFPNLSDSRCFR